jgi:uncharacterized protein
MNKYEVDDCSVKYQVSVPQRSQYNYFVEREEGVMGYNARTGTFALLAKETALVLKGKESIENISDSDTKSLLEMGFLCYDDEISHIMSKFDDVKQQKRILYLTLVPTLSCNFSCDYCFQDEYHHHQFMSIDTQESTLKFVRELITQGRKEVICTWFGGEPLLAKDIILSMSQKLREIVETSEARLIKMDMITNGILLNEKTARELSEVGIESAQVTIDALVFQGTKKRGVIDSEGNPSIILKNIKVARDYLKIGIRINVSADNANEIQQIIEILDNHGFSGSYELAHVHDHEKEHEFITSSDGKRTPACESQACGSCGSGGSLGNTNTSVQKFSALSRPAYARLEQEKFLDRPKAYLNLINKLKPKANPCSATSGQMFVIDPAGYISRCWMSAGSPSEAMENVHNTTDFLEESKVAKQWREFSPLAYPACKTCKVLPLCMGGCSHPRIFMEATKPPCTSIKQQIQFCVDTVGQMLEVTPEKQELVSR